MAGKVLERRRGSGGNVRLSHLLMSFLLSWTWSTISRHSEMADWLLLLKSVVVCQPLLKIRDNRKSPWFSPFAVIFTKCRDLPWFCWFHKIVQYLLSINCNLCDDFRTQLVDEDVQPLTFWFSSRDRFPKFFELSIRYLSVPCSSVDAERSVSDKH